MALGKGAGGLRKRAQNRQPPGLAYRFAFDGTVPARGDHHPESGNLSPVSLTPISRMIPSDIKTGEHYVWGGVCDGWHLLKSPGLSVIQERVPPGASEVRHFHTHAHQFFFVLAGTATLEFPDAAVDFGVHQGDHVPAGTAHRFVNRGTVPVDFLVISSPPTAGDRTNLPPVD